MSESTYHEGGCSCGALRYRASDKPRRVIACHCSSCKRRTGAAYGLGVYFDDADVEFLQGDRKSYEFNSDESGRWVRTEFCPRCGTSATWTLEMRPGLRAIAGGTFDDPNWFRIEHHIWTRSARSDMCYPEGVTLHHKAIV